MIQPVGFFKVHRELFHKPIWLQSTPEQKTVLMTLVAMAWFKANEWEWKGKKFKTEPGQFVTSIESIRLNCGKGISTQNVRSSLKRFEKLEFLTNESTKEGRLVTIVNWGLYQYDEPSPTKLTTKTQQRPNKDPTPKEEGKKGIIKDIVDYLNDVTGKNYKTSTAKTQKVIQARLDEGFTVDDFKNVILTKTNQWKDDSQMSKFLRPETLFGTKFESYLNENTKKIKQQVYYG